MNTRAANPRISVVCIAPVCGKLPSGVVTETGVRVGVGVKSLPVQTQSIL